MDTFCMDISKEELVCLPYPFGHFITQWRILWNLLCSFSYWKSGYLLSRESIRLFIEYGYRSDFAMCTSGHVGAEDVNLGTGDLQSFITLRFWYNFEMTGECLEKIGVIFGESQDPQGRHRFLQFPLNEYSFFLLQLLSKISVVQ